MIKTTKLNCNDHKLIVDTAHNKAFHHCWMTADTWVEPIDQYYKPPIEKPFTSSDLLSAIHRTKWIVGIIYTTKVINDKLSLYRINYRPKRGKGYSLLLCCS
jgi:hypothetical protein